MRRAAVSLSLDGVEVRVTNPDKVFFPAIGATKLDLIRYYVAVAPAALAACRNRPVIMKRYPDGADGPFFYQKRVPESRPEWLQTTTIKFPSGRSADYLVAKDTAHIAWAVNLGCIELHPWQVRVFDVDHPDELRIDLDPGSGVPLDDVRRAALLVREVLEEHGLRGFPKTSGKRGLHVIVRIEPRWRFSQVRRAALALAREVERRVPELVTTAWWKELRQGVFIDYNQNARDRSLASAYSVRPTADARVATPLEWDEVAHADPADYRIDTVPWRLGEHGDPSAAIDDGAGSIRSLLDLAERQEEAGVPESPWAPHFPKQQREPRRRAASRLRAATTSETPEAG